VNQFCAVFFIIKSHTTHRAVQFTATCGVVTLLCEWF